jgi:hypothetical protein
MRYYVQFIAGTGGLLLEALDHYLGHLHVRYRDDSAMVFEASASPDRVAAVPFFKNAFVVIAEIGRGNLDRSITQLSRVIAKKQFPALPGRTGTFRLMVHVDGALTPVDPRARSALERAVADRTRARLEPRGRCQEYWVVGRQDMAELLFCARLTKAARPAKARGAISHELSAMLVSASRPSPRDVFLDPFGGSGSFALARLELPVRTLWYSDTDLARHRGELAPRLVRDKRVRLLAEDALTLPSIADGSVDVIVTDPPWGEHGDLATPYDEFARAVGRSFGRVLHPARGRAVVLVNRRNAGLMRAGLTIASLTPQAEHEVLVNGHPATVLISERPGRAATENGAADRATARTAR